MITLKVSKNQGFSLSLENAVLEKPQGAVKRFRVLVLKELKYKTPEQSCL